METEEVESTWVQTGVTGRLLSVPPSATLSGDVGTSEETLNRDWDWRYVTGVLVLPITSVVSETETETETGSGLGITLSDRPLRSCYLLPDGGL